MPLASRVRSNTISPLAFFELKHYDAHRPLPKRRTRLRVGPHTPPLIARKDRFILMSRFTRHFFRSSKSGVIADGRPQG